MPTPSISPASYARLIDVADRAWAVDRDDPGLHRTAAMVARAEATGSTLPRIAETPLQDLTAAELRGSTRLWTLGTPIVRPDGSRGAQFEPVATHRGPTSSPLISNLVDRVDALVARDAGQPFAAAVVNTPGPLDLKPSWGIDMEGETWNAHVATRVDLMPSAYGAEVTRLGVALLAAAGGDAHRAERLAVELADRTPLDARATRMAEVLGTRPAGGPQP